jgi:hypothetical protein
MYPIEIHDDSIDLDVAQERYYGSGGVWIDNEDMSVMDFDGVFSLPQEVADILEEYGISSEGCV